MRGCAGGLLCCKSSLTWFFAAKPSALTNMLPDCDLNCCNNTMCSDLPQADRVVAAYAQLFDGVAVEETDGGWALITGVGRGAAV